MKTIYKYQLKTKDIIEVEMPNGRDYSEAIWKLVKPSSSIVYKQGEI